MFAVNGPLNCADLYAAPALFQQMWPKLLWAMTIEAVVEQKQTGTEWNGHLPTKSEVTAWLAASHRRWAAGHTDKINKRVHRRIRSVGTQMCLETLDQELRDKLPEHIAGMKRMAEAFAALRASPTIGDFLAYQNTIDLNYSTLTDFSATEFMVPGPGGVVGPAQVLC